MWTSRPFSLSIGHQIRKNYWIEMWISQNINTNIATTFCCCSQPHLAITIAITTIIVCLTITRSVNYEVQASTLNSTSLNEWRINTDKKKQALVQCPSIHQQTEINVCCYVMYIIYLVFYFNLSENLQRVLTFFFYTHANIYSSFFLTSLNWI